MLQSAKAAQIQIRPEKDSIKPGEVVYVPIQIGDEDGTVESNADRKLNVSVEGGELLGFGSANPRTEERFTEGGYTSYYGKAMAVIRAGSSGAVKIQISSDYESVEKVIKICQ